MFLVFLSKAKFLIMKTWLENKNIYANSHTLSVRLAFSVLSYEKNTGIGHLMREKT